MADCPPSTVIAAGKAFEAVDTLGLLLIQTQLLYQIAGSADSVNTLMAAAMANFGAISTDPNALMLVQNQLLCNLQ